MWTTYISLSDRISPPVQVKQLATGHMEFIIIFPAWVGGQIFIVTHMLRPWKQCHIKMLPDVGMVKVYPKCVLKAVNVDWVVTQTRNTPPCSWPFSTSWFFHAATSGIRDTVHHPYIFTCFCGKHFCAPLYLLLSLLNFVVNINIMNCVIHVM